MSVFACVFPEVNAEDPHLVNVTSNSFTLLWVNDDPKAHHEVTVTHLKDHRVILQRNVTGSHLTLQDLEPSQTYHVVVIGHSLKQKLTNTYKGIITTSKLMMSYKVCCCSYFQYYCDY